MPAMEVIQTSEVCGFRIWTDGFRDVIASRIGKSGQEHDWEIIQSLADSTFDDDATFLSVRFTSQTDTPGQDPLVGVQLRSQSSHDQNGVRVIQQEAVTNRLSVSSLFRGRSRSIAASLAVSMLVMMVVLAFIVGRALLQSVSSSPTKTGSRDEHLVTPVSTSFAGGVTEVQPPSPTVAQGVLPSVVIDATRMSLDIVTPERNLRPSPLPGPVLKQATQPPTPRQEVETGPHVPQATTTPSPGMTSPAADVGDAVHTVITGERLEDIASQFQVSLAAIMAYNRLYHPTDVRAGQILYLPPVDYRPSELNYRVMRGESLRDIAARYGSKVDLIVSRNGLRRPDLIYPGQVLVVPLEIRSP